MQETDVLGYVVFEEKGNEELYFKIRTQFLRHAIINCHVVTLLVTLFYYDWIC